MEYDAAFIGTGRVAWSLADAFVDVGYFVRFASNRTEEPLKKFAEEFMVDEISHKYKDIGKFALNFRYV
ncbi:MAG: NAD(P)-binding domain-containing protein [Ignavibacteriales bacterium]|nr:NAD(P)-binding domain-containing protein [Ignavibacteriales bacterium]